MNVQYIISAFKAPSMAMLVVALSVSVTVADQLNSTDSNTPLSAAQHQVVTAKFERALKLHSSGQNTKAAQLYIQLNQEYPQLVAPFLNLAALLAQNGNLERARTTLEAAIETDQYKATLFRGLQEVYAAQAAESYAAALGSVAPKQNQLDLSVVQSLDSKVAAQPSVRLQDTPETTAELAKLRAHVARLTDNLRQVQISLQAREADLKTANDSLSQGAQERKNLLTRISELESANQKSVAVVHNAPDLVSEITQRVNSWAEAWSNQDVANYLDHYSDSFTIAGLTRQQWLEQRRSRLSNRSFIKVDVFDLEVVDRGAEVSVTFSQRYQSDNFDDTVRKRLIFAKDPNAIQQSKIVTEQIVSSQ